jgi:hypothetical protein
MIEKFIYKIINLKFKFAKNKYGESLFRESNYNYTFITTCSNSLKQNRIE